MTNAQQTRNGKEQLKVKGGSHLDDGCINQRLEADEARVPVISCSAVH